MSRKKRVRGSSVRGKPQHKKSRSQSSRGAKPKARAKPSKAKSKTPSRRPASRVRGAGSARRFSELQVVRLGLLVALSLGVGVLIGIGWMTRPPRTVHGGAVPAELAQADGLSDRAGDSARVEATTTAPPPDAGGDVELPAVPADRPSADVEQASQDRSVTTTGRAVVALVIDDLGREIEPLARLSALQVPVSFAVLPFERRTSEVVKWLQERQAETLLHLPMQAQGDADPGPGALYTSLSSDDVLKRTRRALEAVPIAVGVNNHMGSAFSADPAGMRVVLEELGHQGLFFLDSRTSGRSVGYPLAREIGVPAARRSVFLDNDPTTAAIERQFDELIQRAQQLGAAIAIGHPYDETLSVLAERVPRAAALGIVFVPVSYLLERSAGP